MSNKSIQDAKWCAGAKSNDDGDIGPLGHVKHEGSFVINVQVLLRLMSKMGQYLVWWNLISVAIIHFSGIILCVLVICLIAFGPPVKHSPSSDLWWAKRTRFLPLISILFTSTLSSIWPISHRYTSLFFDYSPYFSHLVVLLTAFVHHISYYDAAHCEKILEMNVGENTQRRNQGSSKQH